MTNYSRDEIRKSLNSAVVRGEDFQSFAGTDVEVIAYLPSSVLRSNQNSKDSFFKKFAEIQTLTISSTRSISPVRVLGRSSPLAYTRGARTFAGTLVFASVNRDVFSELYTLDAAESTLYSSTSLVSDQMPPFNIVMTATNEKGAAITQCVFGITLVNYGTTYSIDDLYTEVTYSYVALDVTPVTDVPLSVLSQTRAQNQISTAALKTVSDKSAEDKTILASTVAKSLVAGYNSLPGSARSTLLGGRIVSPGLQRQ